MMGRQVAIALLVLFAASVPLDAVAVEGVGSLTVIVGLAFVPAAALAIVSRGTIRRITPAHYAMIGFATLAVLSCFWAVEAEASIERATTFVLLVVVALLIWQIARTERDALLLMAAYVVGSGVAAAATLANAYAGTSTDGGTRYAAMGFNENDLGVTLVLGIPMAWYLAGTATGWRRLLAQSYIPIALIGMALTGSRGSAVTSLVALLIVPATAFQLRRWALVGICIGVAIVAGLVQFVPAEGFERLLTTGDELLYGTMTHRTDIWAAGWQVFADNWVKGVGVGTFQYAVERLLNWRIVAHNAFLSVAAELGVPGLLLFVAPPVYAAWIAVHTPRHVRAFVWVLLSAWAVGVSSLSWEYRKPTWLVLTISLIMTRAMAIARRSVASKDLRQPATTTLAG